MFCGRLIFLFYFLVSSALLLAQKEANKWYFGEFGNINFNGNIITSTNVCGISTIEGCSSLCDSNGDLLLYTDGRYVLNKNSLIMPNGDSLQGSYTTTQSALIVPDPGDSLKYYVFAGPQAGVYSFAPYSGITYSIVDLSLAGGLGEVTVKNQNLLSPACEKLAGIKHCNQIDNWVIVHEWNSDAFYAYLVTASGISSPIITNIGIINQELIVSGNNSETLGYLKGSPNGKKIASATYNTNKVEVFDFDALTGVLSNPITINLPSENTYGISFSPDNSKLYVSTFNNIFQFDLFAGSASLVIASQYTVATYTTNLFAALQLGPDRRIYISNTKVPTLKSDYLYRINYPNLLGAACGYEINAVKLADYTYSVIGLPNFIENIFDEKFKLDSEIKTCTLPIVLDQGTRQKGYFWSTGETTPTITVNAAGTYWVTVQLSSCASVTDTIHVVDNSQIGLSTLKDINVFTPNNDGVNDEFGFKGIIGSGFELEIYDRWGSLIFQTTDPNKQWDGRTKNGIVAAGVYFWIAEFKREADCDDKIVTNKGFVTLVR